MTHEANYTIIIKNKNIGQDSWTHETHRNYLMFIITRRRADPGGACEDQHCIDFLLSEARERERDWFLNLISSVTMLERHCWSAGISKYFKFFFTPVDVRRLMSERFSCLHKVSNVLSITVL